MINRYKYITTYDDDLTVSNVTGGNVGDDSVVFEFTNGVVLKLFHDQKEWEQVLISRVWFSKSIAEQTLRDALVGKRVRFIKEEVHATKTEPIYDTEEYSTKTNYLITTRTGAVSISWEGISEVYNHPRTVDKQWSNKYDSI